MATNDTPFPFMEYEALREYEGATLISEDGNPYVIERIISIEGVIVTYRYEGLNVNVRGDVYEMLNLVARAYVRAQTRGLNKWYHLN